MFKPKQRYLTTILSNKWEKLKNGGVGGNNILPIVKGFKYHKVHDKL